MGDDAPTDPEILALRAAAAQAAAEAVSYTPLTLPTLCSV